MHCFRAALIVALCGLCGFADGCAGRPNVKAPTNTGSARIQNIAPEEMWKRVTQCVLPTYSELAFNSHVTGAVDIGLGISRTVRLASILACSMDQPCWFRPR
jgi:hypothetical protein